MYKYKLRNITSQGPLYDFYTTTSLLSIGSILSNKWEIIKIWKWDEVDKRWIEV